MQHGLHNINHVSMTIASSIELYLPLPYLTKLNPFFSISKLGTLDKFNDPSEFTRTQPSSLRSSSPLTFLHLLRAAQP